MESHAWYPIPSNNDRTWRIYGDMKSIERPFECPQVSRDTLQVVSLVSYSQFFFLCLRLYPLSFLGCSIRDKVSQETSHLGRGLFGNPPETLYPLNLILTLQYIPVKKRWPLFGQAFPMTSRAVSPSFPKLWATAIPADSRALILSSAFPFPPEIMAPA